MTRVSAGRSRGCSTLTSSGLTIRITSTVYSVFLAVRGHLHPVADLNVLQTTKKPVPVTRDRHVPGFSRFCGPYDPANPSVENRFVSSFKDRYFKRQSRDGQQGARGSEFRGQGLLIGLDPCLRPQPEIRVLDRLDPTRGPHHLLSLGRLALKAATWRPGFR